jgi:uncharacterized protein YdaU (DUF1376 family)
MWRSPKCRVPNDDIWLAKHLNMTKKQVATELRPLIKEFCKNDGNFLSQKRLKREWNLCKRKRQRASASAKSLWHNKKDMYFGNATDSSQALLLNPTLTSEDVKKERVLTAGMNGKHVKKAHPRHGARSKDRRFIYFLRGTPEFVSYSQDFEDVRGAIPQATEFGRWFRYSGEKQ